MVACLARVRSASGSPVGQGELDGFSSEAWSTTGLQKRGTGGSGGAGRRRVRLLRSGCATGGAGPAAGVRRFVRRSGHQRQTAGRIYEPASIRPRIPGKRCRPRCIAHRHAPSRYSRPPTAPRRPRSPGTAAPSTGAQPLPRPGLSAQPSVPRLIFGHLREPCWDTQPSLTVAAARKLCRTRGVTAPGSVAGRLSGRRPCWPGSRGWRCRRGCSAVRCGAKGAGRW